MVLNTGQRWTINVTRHINATLGSNVTIPCTFTYPLEHHTKNVEVYWKKPGKKLHIKDKDPNPFVYHTNDTFVLEMYRGKTMLIGNKSNGNCSLKILNVMENEPEIYVRIAAKGQNYSFKAHSVSISVLGKNFSKTF